jgi:hypothetical protein
MLGIGATLTLPVAHAGFKTCETAAVAGNNIAYPIPEGRIDNAAHAAVGNPFPPSGYVGSAPSPSTDNTTGRPFL